MVVKTGKLGLMQDCDRERRELELFEQRLTPMQDAARRRRDDNVARVKQMLRDPELQDPETREAGIANAREALRVAADTRHQT